MISMICSLTGLAKKKKAVEEWVILRCSQRVIIASPMTKNSMRKKVLAPASFFFFLSAALLAIALGGISGKAPGQDQPKGLKFYALQVVCEKEVQNAKDSLGEPDGLYAEILRGGQLVLLMENRLYSFPMGGGIGEGVGFLDSGSVIGKGGADFSLEGWFVWQDGEGKEHHDWISLGMSASGFCLPLIGSLSPFDFSASTDIIRITNRGAKSLFVDAVIGYDRDIFKKLKS